MTDDNSIEAGDYFLDTEENRFIHLLVENDDDRGDFILPNGIEVITLNKRAFEWNRETVNYKRITNVK